jgi:hypothetical protein
MNIGKKAWFLGGALAVMSMGAWYATSQKTKVCDDDSGYCADVILKDARNALVTDATVTIEQLFGRDPQATSWFYIGTATDADGVGAAGDTVRVQIPAAVSPIGTTLYPAVDVTTTVTAAMVAADNPEEELADQICSDLNNDTNFKAAEWKCEVIRDHSGVFISSRLYNEFGERTTWTVTSTGTTIVTPAYDDFERRGLPTELARSPNNPRQGILAISGTVSVRPGAISDQFQKHAVDGGSSKDLTVDGSVTPVSFTIDCENDFDQFINGFRMWFQDNGIKFGQFMGINVPLSTGIEIDLRSDDTLRIFLAENIKTTEDFQIHLADPVNLFKFHVQAGLDMVIAETVFENPFVIRACGTFPTDDYIEVIVQDNLTSVTYGEFLAFGFRQEP